MLSPEARRILQRLQEDFAFYAPRVLQIKDKAGCISPLNLNDAQLYVHRCIEKQRQETGRVRALILKGRQQGISTYVESRIYWLTSMREGLNAYILTHEQAATDNLFGMAQRFYDLTPAELRPQVDRANAKEMSFQLLRSGYKVATAGSKATGRSGTAQLFHGSEVAFWPGADEHMAGIGQVVPDLPGTEIVLESTANGIGNSFHRMWQLAQRGESEYIAIFVPWFWQREYARPVCDDFTLDDSERGYAEAYGLNDEQMAWRRAKINSDFQGDVSLFDQEYPATPELAFRRASGEPYIRPEVVAKARRAEHEARGALVMGVDPAEMGDDRTAVIFRCGRVAEKPITWTKTDTMETVGRVAKLIEEREPEAIFVDRIGVGAGIYDRLRELFPRAMIYGIHSGERAMETDIYLNRRMEMWGGIKAWLEEGAKLPDDDALAADLCAPSYGYDSSRRLKLERKEDMRKRGVSSPDCADALALTFAYPVSPRKEMRKESWRDKLRARNRVSAQAA